MDASASALRTLNADGTLKELVQDTFDQRISAIVDRQVNELQSRVRLAEQLEKLEARRSNLIDLAADDTITCDDLKAHLASIEDQRKTIQDQLDAISNADAQTLWLTR
jgi:hypothetical protein